MKTEVIACDFDGTLFQRNHGLILPVVEYVQGFALPVVIVTSRVEKQVDLFMADTLKGLFPILAYACGNGKEDQFIKASLMRAVLDKYEVKFAVDDHTPTVLVYRRMGVETITPRQILDKQAKTVLD